MTAPSWIRSPATELLLLWKVYTAILAKGERGKFQEELCMLRDRIASLTDRTERYVQDEAEAFVLEEGFNRLKFWSKEER